jgi:hypothetical protein
MTGSRMFQGKNTSTATLPDVLACPRLLTSLQTSNTMKNPISAVGAMSRRGNALLKYLYWGSTTNTAQRSKVKAWRMSGSCEVGRARSQLPMPWRCSPLSALVLHSVEQKHQGFGPQKPPPKKGINSNGHRDAGNSGYQTSLEKLKKGQVLAE